MASFEKRNRIIVVFLFYSFAQTVVEKFGFKVEPVLPRQ
jgi:hypothetical protein